MNTKDQKTFDKNYQQLLKCLKLQGKVDKTINSYSRALRRVVSILITYRSSSHRMI